MRSRHNHSESSSASRRFPVGSAAALIALETRYAAIRGRTTSLCEPLAIEDYGVQSMPDASPVKWHLAHTSWFFETFVLRSRAGYRPFDPQYEILFNSYYNTVGEQYPRARRGLLSRPTVEEIYRYRQHIDDQVSALLLDNRLGDDLRAVIDLGLHHEQQHQELILTDLKHLFSCNPLRPIYRTWQDGAPSEQRAFEWQAFTGGLVEIGHNGQGFAFDNEGPRHTVFLEPFALATRLITNGDFLAFMDDGGYRRPELWLSDGWDTVRAQGWCAPLYWETASGDWTIFTLGGQRALERSEPVCHVSYYEADAFARWAGARLPLEAEWELVAASAPVEGNFIEADRYHPVALGRDISSRDVLQLFGDVWEWTQSPYVPYPGYRPPAGALGEYNGKFMSSQMVLRGGSCASPHSHLRATYRNFFPPAARWQFTGLRLARDGM